MPTEPKQDRNVEAKTANGRTTGDAIGEAEHLLNETMDKIDPDNGDHAWFAVRITKVLEALADRPSQPPQNVEAGDAVKGVVEEIEKLRTRAEFLSQIWRHPQEQADEEKTLPEDIKALLFSDRLRLALSATGDGARDGDGEIAGKMKAWQKKNYSDKNDPLHEDYPSLCREAYKILESTAPAIIAASSNAERLKVAEGLLREWSDNVKHLGAASNCQCPSCRITRFLSLAPAQTPPRDDARQAVTWESGKTLGEVNHDEYWKRDGSAHPSEWEAMSGKIRECYEAAASAVIAAFIDRLDTEAMAKIVSQYGGHVAATTKAIFDYLRTLAQTPGDERQG